VPVFEHDFALKDAFLKRTCVGSNGISLGSPPLLTVAIINYIETLKAMSPQELKKLGSTFRDMDTDHDGVITFSEFEHYMQSNGAVYGVRFSTEIYTRGIQGIPRLVMMSHHADGVTPY
jgi:hypothetical protein